MLEDAFATMLEETSRVASFHSIRSRRMQRPDRRGRRQSGRSVEIRDLQIAGIAAARRASIATRNVRRFQGLGLTIIDPWSESMV
jgi:predicted nucleic acid-binding protein